MARPCDAIVSKELHLELTSPSIWETVSSCSKLTQYAACLGVLRTRPHLSGLRNSQEQCCRPSSPYAISLIGRCLNSSDLETNSFQDDLASDRKLVNRFVLVISSSLTWRLYSTLSTGSLRAGTTRRVRSTAPGTSVVVGSACSSWSSFLT